jgi:hypothetical protein
VNNDGWWDDAAEPANPERMREALAWLKEHRVLPEFTKGGSYHNKFGELVTWEATADGKCVRMHMECAASADDILGRLEPENDNNG